MATYETRCVVVLATTFEKLHSEDASEASLWDERVVLLSSLLSGRRRGLGGVTAANAAEHEEDEEDRTGLAGFIAATVRVDCCCCLIVAAAGAASSKSLKSTAGEGAHPPAMASLI